MAILKDLRVDLSRRLGVVKTGAATSGTTVTLVDSDNLLDPLASTDTFRTHWLLITSGALQGELRKVSDYAPATGTLTLNRSYSSAPSVADTYELHGTLGPSDLRTCINQALERCLYTTTYDITTVASQREYTLPSWATNSWQPYSVRKRYGNAANEYYWRDVWFSATVNDASVVIEIAPRPAAETLTVYAVRPYTSLTADTDSTNAASELVLAGAKQAAYELLSRPAPGADVAIYRDQRHEAAAEFTRLGRIHQPRPSRRVRFEVPF